MSISQSSHKIIYSSKTFNTYLFDTVDYQNCKQVIMDIDKANKDSEIENILLTISSGGGSLLPAFSLFEHIKNSAKNVDILVDSWCGSAAVMILQAGRHRYATSLSRFKLHFSSHKSDSAYFDEYEERFGFQKELHQQFISLTTSRNGMSYANFKKNFVPTKFIHADDALKLNLIDEII